MGKDNRNLIIEQMIEKSNKIVFLTGAGVSTHSGIPDYRGVDGIYNKSPMEILSREYFNTHPFEVAQFLLEKLQIGTAEPNLIHKWIASIKNATVITQNIDGLHEEAGSKTINFHGTASRWNCLSCKEEHNRTFAIKEDFICSCGGVLEPQIVFYDDCIPDNVWSEAIHAIQEADLMFIVGTSMKVQPFAHLIHEASDKCISVQINNEVINIPTDFKATCDAMEIAKALCKQ